MFASSAWARSHVTTRGAQSIGQQPPTSTRVVVQSASVEHPLVSSAGPASETEVGEASDLPAGAAAAERCAQPNASRQRQAMRMRGTMLRLRPSVDPCAGAPP